MKASIRRGAGWAARVALTVVVTYFLFRSLRLSWSEIAASDAAAWRPRPVTLAASLLALLAVFAYLVGLWSRMVRKLDGPALTFIDAVRIFFLANLGRYVPGKVWQLAGLTYLAGKKGVSLPVASTSAVLGQLFSLAAAACVAAAGLAVGASAGYPQELSAWALALLALVGAVTMIPAALRLVLRVAFKVARGGEEAPEIDNWFGARWLGLYLPAWLGYGIAFGLLWASFPALPPVFWPAAIGGFAAAYFLGYAAIFAPAGVGVREGAVAVLLAPWTGAAGAAVLAVIARLWMTAAELLPLVLAAGARWVRRPSVDSETRYV
ncbi:MAG: flippase-like domain-containing protein [Gemmatimonadota bacterium]|nr:MAG: flippase-like domain-containing protein [Gemmatimonadota bacterium]